MFKKVCNIISSVIVAVLVILVVLLYGGYLFGIKPYSVLTGSMEPTYPVGSVVYIKNINAENLKVGDAISFYTTSSVVATHRIVKIDNVKHQVTTKGDANNVEDAPTDFEQIIGKVVLGIPYLGYVAMWFMSVPGKLSIAAVFLLSILLVFIPDVVSGVKKQRK